MANVYLINMDNVRKDGNTFVVVNMVLNHIIHNVM